MGEKCENEKCRNEKCENEKCKGNCDAPCTGGQGGKDMGAKTKEYGEHAKQGTGNAYEHAKGSGEDMKNKANRDNMKHTYEKGKEMAHKAGEKTKSGAASAYHKTKDVTGQAYDKLGNTGKKDGQ